MAVRSPDDRSRDAVDLNYCRKLGTWLKTGKVTFDEFAYNLTLTIVDASDECMPECVESIPPTVVAPYTDYLRKFLEPVDFMPDPMPFLVGPVSEEDLKRAKQQLRPRYIRLYQLMKEKV
jgi:hypothetical protein